jgi:hypothetical protein
MKPGNGKSRYADLLNFFWARSRAKARAGANCAVTEQHYDKQNV